MKQSGRLNPSEETETGCPVTSKYGRTSPNKHGGVDRQQHLPQPIDIEGVQRFNGFVNYLAKFLPKLREVTEPIRQLTRKDVPWNW